MKQLFIVAIIVVAGFTFKSNAESPSAQHNNESSNGRKEQSQPPSKLYDYVSACLAGRPVPAGVSVGAIDLQVPSNGTSQTATGSGGNGRSVFETSCLKCHDGSIKNASNFTVINASIAANAIKKVQSGEMPKNGSLSGPDKEALITYLNSVK